MEQPKREYYTYEDWLSWDEDIRAEIIDGELVMMSPAPAQRHQEISGEIFRQLANFLKDKPCKVFAAPFGVRLSEEDDSVYEPDLLVVCDSKKLDGKICNGAPDFVAEILSPQSASRDCIVKYEKYLRAGVREYWIVDPDAKKVQACRLHDGKYVVEMYGETDIADVRVLNGCRIELGDVFAE